MERRGEVVFLHVKLQAVIHDFLDENRQSGFKYELHLDCEETVCLLRVRIKQRRCTCDTPAYDRLFEIETKEDLERLKNQLRRLSDTYFFDSTDPTLT